MKKLQFPTAHSVLLIIAALVALSTWIIPAGKYEQLGYDKERNSFVHHAQEGKKEYPATQETLNQFGIKTQVEKFTNGDIWKPIGIPGTFYPVEAQPQNLMDFIQSYKRP